MLFTKKSDAPKLGLILSGGGARAAYQVGVLKAIARLTPKGTPNPFPIICGTSAGAINAAALAIYAQDYRDAVQRLDFVWKNFHTKQVFRSDTLGVGLTTLHWLTALLTGGLGKHNPVALLNRKPLRKLLNKYMPCEKIQASIDAGVLHAISISASGYTSGQSVSFYQGIESLEPWERARRLGCPEVITLEHLMASSAIPLFFKAEKIHREYFGDGSMRQTAPISPALHLGAERILVIGVRQDDKDKPEREKTEGYPNLAQIAGHVLDSIFLDNMEVDLERLTRINNTVEHVANRHIRRGNVALKPVDVLTISPSKDIGKIALRHAHRLPRPVRLLLRGIGAFGSSGSSLTSYLLFEKEYTRELISLGFRDAMNRKEEVLAFLNQED